LQILKAKIEALLKRRTDSLLILPTVDTLSPSRLIFENLEIDPQKCKAILEQKLIPLTILEFELLYFLARHPSRVWERSELIMSVWS
jgi:DNA-binding response OmpR family regulator